MTWTSRANSSVVTQRKYINVGVQHWPLNRMPHSYKLMLQCCTTRLILLVSWKLITYSLCNYASIAFFSFCSHCVSKFYMYLSLTLSLEHLTSNYDQKIKWLNMGSFFTFHMKVCLKCVMVMDKIWMWMPCHQPCMQYHNLKKWSIKGILLLNHWRVSVSQC